MDRESQILPGVHDATAQRQEWVIVHSKGPSVKQRYHHNVATSRLKLNINRGFSDKMFVTHVVHDSSTTNWTIVMDDGQNYQSQELYVASMSLPCMQRHALQALKPDSEAENFLPQVS